MPVSQARLLPIVFIILLGLLQCIALAEENHSDAVNAVSYNRDIRPLISDNCFACHGPDQAKREAGLRLDLGEAAAKNSDGEAVIVPGQPDSSELFRRITASDLDERMPPQDSGHALKEPDIALIRRWIEQGGKYEAHWSFISPRRPRLPQLDDDQLADNPIDYFILSRLKRAGLEPSPPADRETLIRRVSLDIIGIVPTPSEVDTFVKDTSPAAYEILVDRLLADVRYGEHLAVPWLDAARYADTNGYNNDTPRYNWRYRDWLIGALNANISFDQFAIEQLAGDLLPDATVTQQIATGFNRNHNVTSEGGIIDEEYRLEYVADRVQTTSTVFMALTMGCARCHDHKFDPISQKDYYQFFAYFNQVPETGYHHEHVGNPHPVTVAPTQLQSESLARRKTEFAQLETRIAERIKLADAALPQWEKDLPAERRQLQVSPDGLIASVSLDGDVGAVKLVGKADWVDGKFGQALRFDGQTHVELGEAVKLERNQPISYGAWIQPAEKRPMNILSRMDTANGHRGFDLTYEAGPVSVHLIHHSPDNEIKVQTKTSAELNRWTHVMATYDGSGKAAGIQIYFDGKPQPLEIHNDRLSDAIETEVGLRIGRRTDSIPFVGLIDEVRFYDRQLTADEIVVVAEHDVLPEILAIEPEKRTESQREMLRNIYLREADSNFASLGKDRETLAAEIAETEKSFPTAMVMQDQEQMRETFVLLRGAYDKPGKKVSASTPHFLPSLPAAESANRLDMARWLTDAKHPLTARVAMNRLWYQVFGRGIVETLEDFGTQGAWPTHPDLLDWLAVEFVESGWDVKHMLRLMVASATYRQSSRVDKRRLAIDPDNRLLSRGPRFRMTAEMIRDNALSVSGLLQYPIGGPSVRPYQPDGIWTEVSVADDSYSGGPYVQDHGTALYRRSLYTWWKRTCPPPPLNTLDAPEREFCSVRRSRTNTPLQALVLMNDPTFVEASRVFAEQILKAADNEQQRIDYAFRAALSRRPSEQESHVIRRVLQRQLAIFQANPAAAEQLLKVGESPADSSLDKTQLAAWATITSMIFNLDEFVTKG